VIPGQAPRAAPPSGPTPLTARRGWRALAWSFVYAWDGVVDTAVRQRNMRIHLAAAGAVCLVASAAPLSLASDLALLLCIFLVLAAEVANSALEALVDLVTRDRDELARRAKDAGAGAVLVLACASVAVFGAVVVREAPALRRASLADARPAWLLPLAGVAVVALAAARRARRGPPRHVP
jgi:diacylglycerol kinase (ATP)